MKNSLLKMIIISITFLLFFPGVLSGGEDNSFAGGSGTEDDPYLVETADQLNHVRNYLDAHFKQIANIDLTDYSGGSGWSPLGMYDGDPFTGSYDGDGYTITNLFIDRSDRIAVGLFSYTGEEADLSNISLENVELTGDEGVGALVAVHEGTMSECDVTGQVSGTIGVGGLVGYNDGTLMNCSADVEISGSDVLGGLAGGNEGTLTRCFAAGMVSGNDGTGGLTGFNEGNISESYASADVLGDTGVGGLVGGNEGSITNSYARGQVSGEAVVGGLVGSHDENNITNCYAAGQVSGEMFFIGGLVGHFEGGEIVNSYYDEDTTGQSDQEKGIPKSTEEMMQKATFEDWDFEDIWTIEENETYPYHLWEEDVEEKPVADFTADKTEVEAGETVQFTDQSSGDIEEWSWDFDDGVTSTEQNPTHVFEEQGSYNVSLQVSGPEGSDSATKVITVASPSDDFAGGSGTSEDPFQVETAEQLNSVRNYLDAHFIQITNIDLTDYSGGSGWSPLGMYDGDPFTGSYDGDGYTITNLFIDRSDRIAVGLFSYTGEEADLSNISLEDVEITGSITVGALVAVHEGTMTDCNATGQVSGTEGVGGLVGYSEGTITNASADVEASGETHVGGLVGSNQGSLTRGYATGIAEGDDGVGGLVGVNYEKHISECYASADALGDTGVGGLVGGNDGSITNSYAEGQVSGETAIGGLVGAHNENNITNCYAAGQVSGEMFFIGGLVGHFEGGEIVNSYYDEDTTGQSDQGKGIPKSTEEMMQKATFEDWDFEDIWAIEENETYPYHRWEEEPEKDYDAELVSYEIPSLYKERHEEIHLTFQNTGKQTWEKGTDVYLGAVGDQDDLAPSQNWRVALENDVTPLDKHTFTIRVYPEYTGTFTTEWQMLKEGEFWFGDIFSQEVEVNTYTLNFRRRINLLFIYSL